MDWASNTLDFTLRVKPGGKAATRFFHQVVQAEHTQALRVITVDQNAAYLVAIEAMKAGETFAAESDLRQNEYLNNVVEQDYRTTQR
ncbi:MAG: DDE-type integrase/transposase/recombinase [Phormidesmis sp. CAN_BIN44]|nr:DDE-type integrase/transposase/recombinase [Phormidesmis sp. CAN_BIN44]